MKESFITEQAKKFDSVIRTRRGEQAERERIKRIADQRTADWNTYGLDAAKAMFSSLSRELVQGASELEGFMKFGYAKGKVKDGKVTLTLNGQGSKPHSVVVHLDEGNGQLCLTDDDGETRFPFTNEEENNSTVFGWNHRGHQKSVDEIAEVIFQFLVTTAIAIPCDSE